MQYPRGLIRFSTQNAMAHRWTARQTIQRVLHNTRTIAVVGLSNNELRASYFVGYYLKRHGYRVIPVNPDLASPFDVGRVAWAE